MTADLSFPDVASPAQGAARILVADDSPTNVFVLTAMLKSLGLAAVTASDGAEAVAVAAERRPALIFMDVQMPRMDGIAAAQRIRAAQEPGARVVIVAVTAHPEVRHQPAFKAAGFDDVMMKPVDLAQLRHAVEKWMAGPDDRAGATRGPA